MMFTLGFVSGFATVILIRVCKKYKVKIERR